ncbi:MAG: glycoside hydrolase family 9 protein [Lachnospiraceae bacterium]|nr:glycoside hydrolase family 9 protein [Lachnospiraceae bacterium]
MKKRIIITIKIFLFLFLFAGLVGCTDNVVDESEMIAESNEHQFESLMSEAEINYVVPISVPNIMVNQLGYLPGSVKMAVFRGENLPDEFRIINESGQTVFIGEIEERGYNPVTGEYISYGFFTEFDAPGTYYLEAQIVGRSYNFQIENDLYDSVFIAAGRQYFLNRCGISLTEKFTGRSTQSACHVARVELREDASVNLDVSGGWHQDSSGSKDVVTACNVINLLLLSYELNGDEYSDETNIPESGNLIPDLLDEIRYAIDWLKKMQDTATGGVYSGVTIFPNANNDSYSAYIEPTSIEATKMFCATMAKFSYLYQDIDTAYATECLKAADRAWRYLERNHTDLLDEMYFFAAAEMYRAAGFQAYHNIVVRYLNSEAYQNLFDLNNKDITWDNRQETIMMGAVTYLLTRKRVDRALCREIMKDIMLIAAEISGRVRVSQYLTAGNAKQDNNNELLTDMFYLTIINNIIPNHEYGTIIENHLHYFMGRNSAGISYIDDVGALNYKDLDNRLGIMNQIESNAKLIFMISEIKGKSL